MDPSSVQAFGQFNASADLTGQVANLAPLATVYHGVQPGVDAQFKAAAPGSSSQGILPAFWGKIESVGSEAGNLAEGAASFLGHTGVDMLTAPYKAGEGIAKGLLDRVEGGSMQAQSQHISDQLDSLMGSYKSGQISSKQYAEGVRQITQDSTNLQNELTNFQSQVGADRSTSIKAVIGTASDLATILSLGIASPTVTASERAAAASLSSATELMQGATAISKLAANEGAWKAVTPFAQQAIKLATTQVLSAAGKQATAAQLSRAVAVNLLLKYPLTYNALDGTGKQVYGQLDDAKYGDAVKTIAFNAALLFSGGPIGWGLKNAGKLAKATSVAMGLRAGSVLDELSSRIGNGDRRALAQIAHNAIGQGNEADVKSMIVALESNVARANGNSAQAINYIQDHLENYISWGSLKNMSHQQVWDNMVAYFRHAEGLQKLKSAGEISGISADDSRSVVPGRWTVEDKNRIALADSWEGWKQANPNTAAANNPNLDRQISHIFQTIKDPEARAKAIRSIPAQFGLEGIPKEYADKMAKDGYVAIVPKNHNLDAVPFEKTSGKLATSGAEGDFFTKAGSPVPVLRSVGSFLTWAGLSPEVAQQRVGDVFKQSLADQLSKAGVTGSAITTDALTSTKERAANDVLSKLYDYMKSPTGGLKVFGHALPITDMRQLTTNDVVRALSTDGATLSKSDAKAIQQAIMQAHLDVPRQIAGLGTKIMDKNFQINPAAGIYSRIQGVARFAWNPIFEQGKLPIKAELLSQMQTGGKFPTIAGTNTFMKMFFPGQYAEIDGIVADSKFRSLMPGGLGGEAADMTGVTDASGKYPKNALRPVAGIVQSMADKMGLDTKTFMEQYPEKVTDAATAILHYDRKANFLNSPMAKTLNLAFFPFRFNVKVAGFMAKALANQPAAIQYAVVKGTMDAHKFLNSPQGQAWYSQNSDAINLFGYFSPLETINAVSSALGLKHDSVAQYGELGGLPFGMIPLMTDSVGLTHFNQAYVNPKTGAIAKDYVPTSMYGAANAAIEDLLGSLYTYPGAVAGLTSKGTIDRRVVGGILPGSSADFKAVTPSNVTPQEQRFANSVQAANGSAPENQAPPTIQAPRTPGSSVPTLSSPITTPNPNKTIKAGQVKNTKLKKADFRPALLPGQTTLGQL